MLTESNRYDRFGPCGRAHCEHCGTRIIGHGLENGGRMFCCGNCAELSGVKELRDRA